jgi:hypothetical protein
MKRIVEAVPELLNAGDRYQRSAGPALAALVVRRDDLDSLKYLAAKGVDLQTLGVVEEAYTYPSYFFASNLITISPSKRITDYLVSKGVPDFYDVTQTYCYCPPGSPPKGYCLQDSGVYLRKSPSPTAPARALIPKDGCFELLGYSFSDTLLAGGRSRWVKAKYQGKVGFGLRERHRVGRGELRRTPLAGDGDDGEVLGISERWLRRSRAG